MFAAYTVVLVFPLVLCLLSACVFFPPCPQFAEAGTKGDKSNRDVSDAYIAPSTFLIEAYTLCTKFVL